MTNVVTITDASNLMYRNLFPANKENPLDFSFKLWKRLTLHSLIDSINTHNPSRSIIAMDSRSNWRTEVFPDYKVNRKFKREASKIDFDKFFPVANEFWKDFKDTFTTFVVLEVDNCEGDDVITTLVDLLSDFKVINISTDKDFYQEFLKKNYSQYHPSKREFIQVMNPKRDLEYKIIDGDKGDDIPPIYKVQHKTWERSKKVVEKLLDGDLEEFLKDPENLKLYERNKTLIDFKCIPIKYKIAIKDAYEAIETKPLKRNAIIDFLKRHDLRDSIDDIQGFSYSLRKIT